MTDSTVGADGPHGDAMVNPMCTDGGVFCKQASNLCDDFDTSAIDPSTWTTTKTSGAVVELTQTTAVTCPNSVHTSIAALAGTDAHISTTKIPISNNASFTLDVDAMLPNDTDTSAAFIALHLNGNATQGVVIEHTQTQWQLGLHDVSTSQSAALTVVPGQWTHFTLKVTTQTDTSSGAGQYKVTATLTYSTGNAVTLGHDIDVPAGINSGTLDLGIVAVASTHAFDAYYDNATISN